VLLGALSVFGQGADEFEQHRKLKQDLVEKHINPLQDSGEQTNALILGTYRLDIVGCGALTNITLYNNSIYKFENTGPASGYYDIGTYSFKENVVTLTSLLSNLADHSKATYHNKIVDMTDVTFLFSTTYEELKITIPNTYSLTSFGEKADALKIINGDLRAWIKSKHHTSQNH
jgi:hypothetical protein